MNRSLSAKRTIALAIILILFAAAIPFSFGCLQACASGDEVYTKEELTSWAKEIVAWRISAAGFEENIDLVSSSLSKTAGSTESDWYVIAMARMGLPGDYNRYLSELTAMVESGYRSDSKLSASKATEWHRIVLAILACGGDPTALGGNINLIADGTYNRGWTKPLDNQGNNGPIYGLIALDAMNYKVPYDAFESRDDILQSVLDSQLADGGFSQSGSASDVDMTAMALTALAPYAQKYPDVINKGLSLLSAKQSKSGGFSSGGVENAESTAQVIIALTSLGMNPQTDPRFVKEGHSSVDALSTYRTESGGMRHTASSAENDMAAQQSLCALAALIRQTNGQSALYRFTSENPLVGDTDVDSSNPSEEMQEGTEPESTANKDVNEVTANPTMSQGDDSPQDPSDSEVESMTSAVTIEKYRGTYIFAGLSILCFFIAFKTLHGRKRDRIFFLGFAFALAAVFFLAMPETVAGHYSKVGKQDTGNTVTISISCSTIYNHLEELDDTLRLGGYLPENGIILKQTEYPIESGDTVFDVLTLAVLENQIQIDYEGGNENIYDTVYVRGLQYLYEFSCGELSGWTYAVNGDFPDVGCSSYTVSGGDEIEWLYTCDLGRDVTNVQVEAIQ